jgi:hypothetical protein
MFKPTAAYLGFSVAAIRLTERLPAYVYNSYPSRLSALRVALSVQHHRRRSGWP